MADSAAFERCVQTEPVPGGLFRRSVEFGGKLGIEGTPGVVVDGWRYDGAPSRAMLEAIVNSGLQRRTWPVPTVSRLRLDSLPLARPLGIAEEMRLGGPQDAGALLSTVGSALVGGDGETFVSQPQLPGVVVFDSLGRVRHVLGGAGEGPGEFQDVYSIGMLGDTLYVSDRALGRVSYFRNEQFLASRRWIAGSIPGETVRELLFFPNVPEVVLEDGRALVVPNAHALPVRGRSSASVLMRTPVLVVSGESQVLDTLAWEELRGVAATVAHRGNQYQAAVPFQRTSFTELGPGGSGAVIVADSSGHLVVTGLAPSGDTIFAHKLRYTPLPLAEEGIEIALRNLKFGPQPLPKDEVAVRDALEAKVRREEHLPEHYPAVSELFVGQDGTVWLRREESAEGTVDYTVLWGDGRPRGKVAIPADQRVVAALDDVMVAVAESELGVPTLVRYRVQR